MASNRHLGRIVALQTLYEFEFRKEVRDDTVDQADILTRNLEKYESSVDDIDFVKNLVSGVLNRVAELDELLRPLAPEWPLEQIARIDRAVLRIGLYELMFSEESVPPKVVINEASKIGRASCRERV